MDRWHHGCSNWRVSRRPTPKAAAREVPMRQFGSGDSGAENELRRAEEALALARALTAGGLMVEASEVLMDGLTARRAFRSDSRPPRRPARLWLGSVLLAIGHRLLRTSPRPAATA